ncbi:unnamed protein product [Arabidopsis lyrata]|uniref:Predicted protein n=1 Tax=Arabidopsis lyrata subsp. lyrata TaxID=81972 RepID=D7KB22_ARALL|nr:predicted protein [Arabidopsis lyrata subsp. lyrata]CAH8256691.1 unnamed protein product [Arabidopsis lyrata]
MLVLVESIFLIPCAIAKYKFLGKYLDIAKNNIKTYPWKKILSTYAQIWCNEESKGPKVTCVFSSFNDAVDLSALLDEQEDDDLGGISLSWKKTEEFISQMDHEVEFDVGDYVSPRLEACVLPRLEAPTHHLSASVRLVGDDREVKFDEMLDRTMGDDRQTH